MSQPRISVIVAVTHRDVLGPAVTALAHQTLPASEYEAIIVDCLGVQPWGPLLPEFVAATGKTLNYAFHSDPRPGVARARANNIGIRHASADLLLFAADDFVLEPGSVEAHLRFHEAHPDPCIVGVAPGFFSAELRRDTFSRWIEDSGDLLGVSFTADEVRLPPDFFYVGNSSLKRALLERAGNFDEDFPYDAWDDYELSLRLFKQGMHALHVPEAPAIHDHRYSLAERRQSLRKAAESAVILEGKYPGPHGWQVQCGVAPWRHRAAGLMARAAHLITRRPAHLHRYYRSILAAEFVGTYRDVKARRTPLPPSTEIY